MGGLLSSVVVQNHCRGLRPGYGHPLRNSRAVQATITDQQPFFPTCYGAQFNANQA